MTAEPSGPPETTGSAPVRTPPKRPAQKDQPKAHAQKERQAKQQAPIDLNSAARGAPTAQ
jgi:hypothetical protein